MKKQSDQSSPVEVMLGDEEIGKENKLTSFVLDLDLEVEQSAMSINESV